MSRRHHRDHALGRGEVPVRRGIAAGRGGGVPPRSPLDRPGHPGPRVQRPAAVPAPRDARRGLRHAGHRPRARPAPGDPRPATGGRRARARDRGRRPLRPLPRVLRRRPGRTPLRLGQPRGDRAAQRHLADRLRRRRRPHGQRGGGLRRDGHRGHRRTGHRRGAAQRGAGLRAHLGLCPVTVGSQPASQRRRLPGHRRGHRRRHRRPLVIAAH